MAVKKPKINNYVPDEFGGYMLKDVVYVTPEMFGAVGDGVADDTEALSNMFATSPSDIFLLENKYAVTSPLNAHGVIVGTGTILSKNSGRIEGGLLNISGDTYVNGITFDCLCSVPYVESDYGTNYQCGIYCVSNSYDVIVENCKFINGYASAFIYFYTYSGYIRIEKNEFKADLENNKWSGYMIAMQTIGGTDSIDIIGNKFYGNGDATSNFSGIFMSNITTRNKINIGENFFSGVGRNKTGGHQSHCIDAYWDVSHLNVYGNVLVNNAYCCLRIHGGTDFDIYDNYFGNANISTTDSCVLVQDDKASTGVSPLGVSDVKFRNNVFESDTRYNATIQMTSQNSDLNGSISGVVIMGNKISGLYVAVLLLDGSVKDACICDNIIKSTSGGITFNGAVFAFSNTSEIIIANNLFEIKGGAAIASVHSIGDILLRVIGNYFRTYGYAVNMYDATQNTSALKNTIIGTRGFNNVYAVGDNVIYASDAAKAIVGAVASYSNYINGSLPT